jgi:hypothetical protein
MENENRTPDQLIANIEKLEMQLEMAERRQQRDAEKLETISNALISIIEDGINNIVDARLGAAVESAVDNEIENRDLVSRYDFFDLFDEGLADVEVNLSR